MNQTVSRRRAPPGTANWESGTTDILRGRTQGERPQSQAVELQPLAKHSDPLKILHNSTPAVVLKPEPPGASREGYGLTGAEARKFFVENNLAFTLFIVSFVIMFIYLLVFGFSRAACAAINAYFLGKFKRPLPHKPELYFDVNCINTMQKEDYDSPDQVRLCYEARNINRRGPPRIF